MTIALEHLAPEQYLLIFIASALADIAARRLDGPRHRASLPSGWAKASAELLNATFGNAAELIIALAALRAGLHDVVKASIAGSIVGNILLVLGAAMLAGRIAYPQQHFNARERARKQRRALAAIALIASRVAGRPMLTLAASRDPARRLQALRRRSRERPASAGLSDGDLDRAARRLTCCSSSLACNSCGARSKVRMRSRVAGDGEYQQAWPVKPVVAVLAGATVFVAWMSEILVGTIEPTAHKLGLSNVFVGVFVVAILGNAAEHADGDHGGAKEPDGSVTVDRHRIERAGGPVRRASRCVVLLSLVLGPMPMDLAFPAGLY